MGEEAVPSPHDTLGESQVVGLVPVPSASAAPSFPQREPQVKSRPKVTYTDKVADISMRQGFLPEDKDFLHNTGIPMRLMPFAIQVPLAREGPCICVPLVTSAAVPLMSVTLPAQEVTYTVIT